MYHFSPWLLLISNSLCYKQGFYPWPVKFLELSDKGQFQPQSQQVQDSAQMFKKNVGQLCYTQQCEDKGFTETSLQRRIKVEHSFIIQ